MQHIETVVVGSGGAASITFSAIPATFTDLVVVMSLRNSVDTATSTLAFNVSGGTYTTRRLLGSGSAVSSSTSRTDYFAVPSSMTASTFGNTLIYIPNYAGSAAKSYSTDSVTENNATLAQQSIIAGLWSETDAITSIALNAAGGGNWVEHSSASLYGITAGSDGITAVS